MAQLQVSFQNSTLANLSKLIQESLDYDLAPEVNKKDFTKIVINGQEKMTSAFCLSIEKRSEHAKSGIPKTSKYHWKYNL